MGELVEEVVHGGGVEYLAIGDGCSLGKGKGNDGVDLLGGSQALLKSFADKVADETDSIEPAKSRGYT